MTDSTYDIAALSARLRARASELACDGDVEPEGLAADLQDAHRILDLYQADRRGWPYATPTGHVYPTPATYDELCSRHTDAAQAYAEHWDPAECPPEPTWELVGLAHKEVQLLRGVIDRLSEAEKFRSVYDTIPQRTRWLYEALASASTPRRWEVNFEAWGAITYQPQRMSSAEWDGKVTFYVHDGNLWTWTITDESGHHYYGSVQSKAPLPFADAFAQAFAHRRIGSPDDPPLAEI